jgi:hypothetical protein
MRRLAAEEAVGELLGAIDQLLSPQQMADLAAIEDTWLGVGFGAGFVLGTQQVPSELVSVWRSLQASQEFGDLFSEIVAWADQLPQERIGSIAGLRTARKCRFDSMNGPSPCNLATADAACTAAFLVLEGLQVPCAQILRETTDCADGVTWDDIALCVLDALGVACAGATSGACYPVVILAKSTLAASALSLGWDAASAASACADPAGRSIEVAGTRLTFACRGSSGSSPCGFGPDTLIDAMESSIESGLESVLGPGQAVDVEIVGSDPIVLDEDTYYRAWAQTFTFSPYVVVPESEWAEWWSENLSTFALTVEVFESLGWDVAFVGCILTSGGAVCVRCGS